MSSRVILAVDQGTTNTKALLLDSNGGCVASASRPLSIHFPQPAWVEQDADELWSSALEAIESCLAQSSPVSLAAIGVSNQRESVVVWDRRTGRPIAPCVVWQCRRSAPFCDELRRRGAEGILRERTGLAIDPLFSASKARWLLEHTPDGYARAANGELCIGTVDSWVLWNLTGGAVHACDVTNASRTQLLNLRRQQWDQDLLELFGIPEQALPQVQPSSYRFGETVRLGSLPAGVPVASLIGDSHAALFGHAIFTPGAVKATYGTGSSLMTITETPLASAGGLSTTVAWSAKAQTRYALEGNISFTGGAVQWLGEFLRLPNPAADVAKLAMEVADSGGVYLVPAFVGLGAPYWNDRARGLLTGLTRGATAAHAARATIEAIAYQVRDVFDVMEQDAGQRLPALLADGGASQNDFLMQFQADILGRPVVRSVSSDVSAIGAAWLAGLAVGVWSSFEELKSIPRPEQRFEPKLSEDQRARPYAGWRDAVGQALGTAPVSTAAEK
ncbi:MAG TPA: glycerol kinase GlpK [Bryobacteraceae bacterium]|nr:glycerol kinase GlpK [Bryobacteraceae bacterium]